VAAGDALERDELAIAALGAQAPECILEDTVVIHGGRRRSNEHGRIL
jgi:hypothetical protein